MKCPVRGRQTASNGHPPLARSNASARVGGRARRDRFGWTSSGRATDVRTAAALERDALTQAPRPRVIGPGAERSRPQRRVRRLLWPAVAHSPGEAVRAFLRMGYEISRLIRCSGVARRDVAGPRRSGTRSNEGGPAFPRRLCATATPLTSGGAAIGSWPIQSRACSVPARTLRQEQSSRRGRGRYRSWAPNPITSCDGVGASCAPEGMVGLAPAAPLIWGAPARSVGSLG